MEHRMDQHKPEFFEKGSVEDGNKLPPRSKTRQEKRKKKKEKYKWKYPLISALSIFFISLPAVAYFSYKHYAENQASFLTVEKKEETGYEVVDFAEPIKAAEEKEDVREIEQSDVTTLPAETKETEDDSLQELPSNSENTDAPTEGEKKQTTSEETPQIIQHTVQPNETLFSIAMHYYGDVKGTKTIREWNNLENGQLKQGQVLNIPLELSAAAN